MKKKILFILMIASILLIINCVRKDSTDTYVYTSKSPSENTLYLYIDNKYIGELPYLEKNTVKHISSSKALNLSLKYGSHIMTAKDKNGNDISSLKIDVASYVTSSSGLVGSHSQSVRGLLNRRIIVDMF
ncbi:MAG TPA: hypothetical protein VK205_06640 [Prolixibacteraceae bacterium]|nr:hypothetical protein [Prolixibacteraceae bacterium]